MLLSGHLSRIKAGLVTGSGDGFFILRGVLVGSLVILRGFQEGCHLMACFRYLHDESRLRIREWNQGLGTTLPEYPPHKEVIVAIRNFSSTFPIINYIYSLTS